MALPRWRAVVLMIAYVNSYRYYYYGSRPAWDGGRAVGCRRATT
ncbi:MAG: hypothetical protein ACJ74W_17920 [Pyrinomonadaceae bacterium]